MLELLLASVLGFIIYRFVYGDKEETLPLDDGWWGPGSRPSGREDESIRPFKVETSDEEIKVRAGTRLGAWAGWCWESEGHSLSWEHFWSPFSQVQGEAGSREVCPASAPCNFSFALPKASHAQAGEGVPAGSSCQLQRSQKALLTSCEPHLKTWAGTCVAKTAGSCQGLGGNPEGKHTALRTPSVPFTVKYSPCSRPVV